MKKNKVWITGNGMVGKALVKRLSSIDKYEVLVTKKNKLDQTNQKKVGNWVIKNKPDTIIITSALVGGIQLNSKIPATFLYQNSMINLNIINAAHQNNCNKIIFLGASCMYPRNGEQPFKEDSILDGKIEETNEGYGISKIVGLKMIQMLNQQFNTSHISIIPAASYGPNDCYDEAKNHVVPAMLKKFHDAKNNGKKSVTIWGTGKVKREFIHVDDMADGIIHIMKNYKDNTPINLGTGEEITIKRLAILIKKIVGYKGVIIFDEKKPDGIKRKILCHEKLKKLKWKHTLSLEEGIKRSYEEYILNTLLR
ncbi:MAG: GDP-L-fucose synthase [Gammaproteobacteria bacterium]|jgi:GDP-L-fucose synthase|nr:GDP-L-fucose synthase [Gammaproteobacteria bacterium]